MNSQTDSIGNKQSGRRGRFWKVLLGLVVVLVTLYTLAVGWLLPHLGKGFLQDFVKQNLKRELRVQSIDLNPFTLQAAVNGVELRETDGELLISLQSLAVEPNLRALAERRIEIGQVRLLAPWIHLRRDAGGKLNLAQLAEDAGTAAAAGSRDEAPSTAEPLPFLLQRFSLNNGALKISDETGSEKAVANLLALDVELLGFSTEPGSEAEFTLDATMAGGGRFATSGRLGLEPLAAEGRLSLDRLVLLQFWKFVQDLLDLEPPQGDVTLSADYRFGQDAGKTALQLEKMALQLERLRLQRPDVAVPMLAIDRLEVTEAEFDLQGNRLEIAALDIDGGALNAVRQGGRLDWERIVKARGQATAADGDAPTGSESAVQGEAGPAVDTDRPPASAGAQPDTKPGGERWQVALKRFSLGRFAIGYSDRDLARPVALGIGAANLELAASGKQVGNELSANLDAVVLGLDKVFLARDGDKERLLALERVQLQEGRLDLGERRIEVGSLQLNGGHTRVIRRKDGRLEWERVWLPAAGGATAAARSDPSSAGPGWRVSLAALGVSGFSLAVRDATTQPPAALDLKDLELQLKEIDSRLQKPIELVLSAAVAQGGRLTLSGTVDPASPAAELDLDLDSISLLPTRSYLKPFVRLALDSGSFSTDGRLSYGKSAPGALGYSGHARVDNLLISEHSTGEPLLGWRAMEVAGIDMRLKPDRLQIEELKFDQPQGKFVVNEDLSTNWQQILHPQSAATVSEERHDDGSASAFPVGVGRVSLASGKLDFADLSLPAPFATKIHELEGAIVGISSEPGAKASSDLKGRVDEFGAATIKGEIAPFDPLLFTDMGVAFSNLDVPSLTPYSAKFAGYEIDSGKLSLDLKYRIEGRQLQGENQIVLEKLKLGEKVESPDAIDAPLELAIALMEDSRGVIDLGLPISGNLDDPEFSYGHLVFKAIGNLLTKIVTAPFKVLGALLGVEGEDLDAIAFEPGSAELAPPQQEKLQAVAKALAERPALKLEIQGRYHETLDANALRETALRVAINGRLGRKPRKGRDPDPISLTDTKTKQVVEALYAERFSAAELAKLKTPAKKPATGGAGQPARSQPVSADLYQRLYAGLIERQPLARDALSGLGRDRGERIAAYLGAEGKMPAIRVMVQPPVAVESPPGVSEQEAKVESKLDLAAGK